MFTIHSMLPWATSSASKPGEFVIAGKGDKKVRFTSVLDIGGIYSVDLSDGLDAYISVGYVAHTFTSIPFPELYNKSLLIEGQAARF